MFTATRFGYLKIVQYLIDNKANVNQADKKGSTPLYVATCQGNLEVVRVLINNGAFPWLAYKITSNNLMTLARTEESQERARKFILLQQPDSLDNFDILPDKMAYIMGYTAIEDLLNKSMSLTQSPSANTTTNVATSTLSIFSPSQEKKDPENKEQSLLNSEFQ